MNTISSCETRFSCRGCTSPDIADLLKLDGFPRAAPHFLQTAEQAQDDAPITLNLVECQDCGLVQLKNPPVDYYKDVITAAALSPKSREILVEEWRPLISRFALAGKKALEIGACKGDFLAVLDQLGLDAFGMEHSRESVAVAREKGYKVSQGYVVDAAMNDQFDLIVCNNYLEHQPDVKIFLKEVRKLVSDEGVVYFSVPNLDYLLQRSCLYEFVADHLVYFSEKSLHTTFENNGFVVKDQYLKNNGNDLVVVAKKAPRLNLSAQSSNMQGVVESFRSLLRSAKESGKKVVSWGAGHRALALLALADARTIEYVVDSAPFKQNLLTPITHIPIKSPDYLIKHGCDVLLLMLPGNFAKQVQDYLNDAGINCTTIIFNDAEIDIEMIKGVGNGNN